MVLKNIIFIVTRYYHHLIRGDA